QAEGSGLGARSAPEPLLVEARPAARRNPRSTRRGLEMTAAPPRWVPTMLARPRAPPRSVSRPRPARARPGPTSGPLQEVRTQPRSPAVAPVVARSAASVWPLARALTPAQVATAPQPVAAAERSQPPPGPLPR